ncbi:MAG TPA: bifunctional metallophosphatase/5'-nucleotidase [Fimbriimonas sp.]|nr:bifunctional metallophosphatase/5'-nucleotidase [Fimbriimonas sp.]
MKVAFLSAVALLAGTAFAQRPLTVTVLHMNDIHSHLDPTPIRGVQYGGLARVQTLIKGVRAKEKNVLLLNAGDVFQGTLYFNMYDGLADATVLNEMGFDAQCLGNHEFDKGIPNLVEYIKRVNFPVLAANVDTTNHPELGNVIKPYSIITVDKQKVGVIGLVTDTTPTIAFIPETLKFQKHLAATQKAADELTAQGVNKIILLTHIGYEEDMELGKQLRNVDLIVGGHSHTPLGTPPLEGWRPSVGKYPTVVKDADGKDLNVVQAWEWGKVLGRVKVTFDKKGNLVKVNEGEIMVVDSKIPEDKKIAGILDAFRKPIDAIGSSQIGTSVAAITDRHTVGYFVSDSYLMATQKLGADFALCNPGGVRSNLEAGKVTYGMANAICPFRNTLTLVNMTGATIIDLLNESKGSLIPSKGTSYTVAGGGVRDVMINGAPLDPAKTYKVVVNNFMAQGGDSLNVLKAITDKVDTGFVDIDALVDYIKANSPLDTKGEIRVRR